MINYASDYWTGQKVNYFLARWYLLEREIATKDKGQLANIKSFFFRLSYLNTDQQDFLAYMYYKPDIKSKITIKQAAKHFGMTVGQAQRKKSKILRVMRKPRKFPKGVKPTDNAKDKPNLLTAKELARNKAIHELFKQLQAFHSESNEELPT